MSATRFDRTQTAPDEIGTPSRSFVARPFVLALGILLAGPAAATNAPASPRAPGARHLEQEAVRVTTDVRPNHVRVGQTAVLTIKVVTAGGPPRAIDIEAHGGLEVLTYADGQSTTVNASGTRQLVLERRFEVRPLEAGRLQITALVVSGDGSEVPAPPVTLVVDRAALDWAPAPGGPPGGDPRDRILPEGVPPASSPDTREVVPGGVTRPAYPGPMPYPGAPAPYAGRPTPYGTGQGRTGAPPYPGGARNPNPGGPNGWPSVVTSLTRSWIGLMETSSVV